MFVKQIDQDTALELCKKGVEVKVLITDNDGDWQGVIPDTLQNMLDGCMFFRSEPAMVNEEFEKNIGGVTKALPHQAGEAAGDVGAGSKRQKVDAGKRQ